MHIIQVISAHEGQPIEARTVFETTDDQELLQAIERIIRPLMVVDPETGMRKPAQSSAAATVFCDREDSEISKSLNQQIAKGNTRSVRVLSVEDRTDVKAGDAFMTAAQASSVLGYNYNAVVQDMSKARAKGGKSITLRGVTLCYAPDYNDLAYGNIHD